jgi:hypothetical protein
MEPKINDMASNKYEEKYTRPELREQLKEEIKQSDKGGKPGQWSARKSQLLVQEYEKQGGGYKKNHKDQAARSLENWTDQDWQTIEGDGEAREDGKTKRYLPKTVWEQLTEQEKKEAEMTKEEASRDGRQLVPWTNAIKRAFEKANISTSGLNFKRSDDKSKAAVYEQAKELDIEGRSRMSKEELRYAISKHEQIETEASRDELYEKAQELDIDGRSQMNKKELKQAIDRKKRK